MKYFANFGGRDHSIDIEAIGPSNFKVRIDDGPEHVVDAERLYGRTVHLLIDHHNYNVDLDSDGDALLVAVRGKNFRFELADERKHRLQSATGFHAAGPQILRAPMPGKIVKVLAPEGTEVAEGQGVIVIEAMKMENELRAAKAGKVTKVHVKEGQTVEGKSELIVIE